MFFPGKIKDEFMGENGYRRDLLANRWVLSSALLVGVWVDPRVENKWVVSSSGSHGK